MGSVEGLRLAGDHRGLEGRVHLLLGDVVADHALHVLENFLEGRLVSLLEGNYVLARGLGEQGHVLDLAPALEVLVPPQTLHAVRVLREVPVVQAPVVPQEETAQVEGQLRLLDRRRGHYVLCQVHLAQ